MTDFGKRPGDMFKSVYDTDDSGVVDDAETAGAHKTTHQDGGADEISVAALSGELADDQPPKAHALGGAKHTAATLAELNAKVSDAALDDSGDTRTPAAHKASHQDGGSDEIDVTGLVGSTGYVDRGDPAAYDWTVGNFTTDGTWYDLDCSSIVPAGAKAIQFRLNLTDDLINQYFQLRENGNTDVVNTLTLYINVAGYIVNCDGIVTCDLNRVVEYRASNTTFTAINLVIKGWFI